MFRFMLDKTASVKVIDKVTTRANFSAVPILEYSYSCRGVGLLIPFKCNNGITQLCNAV